METRKERIENVERALLAAYRKGVVEDRPLAGSRWEQDTVRRIRAVGPLVAGTYPAVLFGSAVWRLAPVAAALILVLGTWMMQMDLTMEIEQAALLDPIGFDMISKLGIL
ncbi:MAG: hypothetical protein JEZ11_26630 [Desulfobacterales bacterium]|nr:hypothetical protein [Desulfobacterales bacterium]